MRFANAAKNAIWSVDHGVPILGYTTLHNVVSTSLMARRASVSLVSGFALLAIVLSLIGIYGVLSRAVVQRTQEIGIRLAVGARPVEITRLVLEEGIQLATAGMIVGLSIAGFAGSLVSRLLFSVHRFDPLTYVMGCALILLVSVLASYLPARRAWRIDPMEALRCE
jgi:ABC-type antimicrobial peptide transport system permease subunit